MINSFENYLKLGKARSKTPDKEEARSLLEKSAGRLDYVKSREISNKSASFVLEDAYEAVRESAQALMSSDGFKPYSHEATISFIREFYGSQFGEDEIKSFDRFRQLRNDSVYKAVPISKGDAADCLRFAINFINKIKSILKHHK